MNTEKIKEIKVQSVMTRSSLPVGGYSVNPYVGCPHACKYCYASFMKRFTGHTEPWGSFLDVKHWKPVGNPHRFDGQLIVIGSVTDGYNPFEEQFRRTRHLPEELRGNTAEISESRIGNCISVVCFNVNKRAREEMSKEWTK